jgi:hypothetical protein
VGVIKREHAQIEKSTALEAKTKVRKSYLNASQGRSFLNISG